MELNKWITHKIVILNQKSQWRFTGLTDIHQVYFKWASSSIFPIWTWAVHLRCTYSMWWGPAIYCMSCHVSQGAEGDSRSWDKPIQWATACARHLRCATEKGKLVKNNDNLRAYFQGSAEKGNYFWDFNWKQKTPRPLKDTMRRTMREKCFRSTWFFLTVQ